MRTKKIFEAVIPMAEWTKEVQEHYTDDEQNKRIEETVKFIYTHCSGVYQNKRSTFSGVWGYLDVDAKHLKKFKRRLKGLFKTNFIKAKITYNTEENDIVVVWE